MTRRFPSLELNGTAIITPFPPQLTRAADMRLMSDETASAISQPTGRKSSNVAQASLGNHRFTRRVWISCTIKISPHMELFLVLFFLSLLDSY